MSSIRERLHNAIGEPLPDGCSSFSRLINGVVEAVFEDRVQVSIRINPMWDNGHGVIHSGMMAAILNDLMGLAAMLDRPEPIEWAIVDQTIQFLASATTGDTIQGTAKVERRSTFSVKVSAGLKNSDGNLLASSQASLEPIHNT